MNTPSIKLANNLEIPQVGLGLWKVKDDSDFRNAFRAAINVGYRHFDTAQAYNNEHLLGQEWKKTGLKREELFITTKIFITHFKSNSLQASFKESLEKLGTDYVDLLLLHFPVPVLRKKAWLELEKINADGKAKSIGVSNYTVRHLKEMDNYANQKPAINQVELNVFLQQPELVKYCRDNNIQIEAYSPLAHGHLLDTPAISEIAKKHNKTNAQIMLRWLAQQDFVLIPKSVNPKRIAENINIFDFQLDNDDLGLLTKQDLNKRFCWNPTRVP
jgi:diketogulonate reductase-like aldo/keto reductase